MPPHDRTWITCPKCGTKVDVRSMRQKNALACLYCKEPIMALVDLERCDWSSGDYFPAKEERG